MNSQVLRSPSPIAEASPTAKPVKFNAWITCPQPKPTAAIRLFCLPFAGGGASVFRTWGRSMVSWIEVCPIQLPGRENRFNDPPHTDIRALATLLADQIEAYADKPFALFGHSMGALLSFEVARVLKQRGGTQPLTLFLSAHRAAHLPLRRKPLYHLPEPEFIEGIRDLGGFPEGVLENKELRDFLLPVLRADLALCDGYRYVAAEPLACPLVLYGGRQDSEVAPEEIHAWQDHSTGQSEARIFPGDHFFLRADAEVLLKDIADVLARFARF